MHCVLYGATRYGSEQSRERARFRSIGHNFLISLLHNFIGVESRISIKESSLNIFFCDDWIFFMEYTLTQKGSS